MSRSNRGFALVFATLLLVAVAVVPLAAAANKNEFSGRAVVAKGTIAGIAIPCVITSEQSTRPGDCGLVDTGNVAAGGGELEACLAAYPNDEACALTTPPGFDPLNGALQLEALHAAVVAGGNRSSAEASAASLALNVAGITITADALVVEAEVKCEGGDAVLVKARTTVADLYVDPDGPGGLPAQQVTVTGEVNQKVDIPGGLGTITINEQTTGTNAEGSYRDVTVTALHIVLPGGTDVYLVQAHADILCARPAPPPPCDVSKDFVTSGGWIIAPNGQKGNFGAAGGKRTGWGHLTYSDKTNRVKALTVENYSGAGTVRRWEGNADVNGSPHRYFVELADNGEPGNAPKGSDTFKLSIPTFGGYLASGVLQGGNVQLHKPNC